MSHETEDRPGTSLVLREAPPTASVTSPLLQAQLYGQHVDEPDNLRRLRVIDGVIGYREGLNSKRSSAGTRNDLCA